MTALSQNIPSAFVWSDKFSVGLSGVDDQHRHLVELINELGRLSADATDRHRLPGLLKELVDYTAYHFTTEEALMQAEGVDRAHYDAHVRAHAHFCHQVDVARELLSRGGENTPALIEQLLEYLAKWLLHHILGTDTRMAHEIRALREGASHAEARQRAAQAAADTNDVLVEALNGLYMKIGEKTLEALQKNAELEEERQKLETRVRQRTAELEREKAAQAALIDKLEAAHTQLLQSEKMASIGQLAAGIAHEINNPIGFVNSNLGTLGRYLERLFEMLNVYTEQESGISPAARAALAETRSRLEIDYLKEDIPDLLRESMEGLDRVKQIIQDLKDFSHVEESNWQLANLEKGMDSTLNVVWNEIKYKAEVRKEYAGIPEIECLPSQINQVVMNLLVNAAQAIEEHGIIHLRTGLADGWIWLEVEDTGKGIAPEHLNRIFEPFFTTKPIGHGTGLGLSVSYGIVEKHAGRIEISSVPGQGTRARVWLPLKRPVAAQG